MQLTAVYISVPEGGYVAFVEELAGANTQGRRWTRPGRTSGRPCAGHRGQSRAGGGVAPRPGRDPRTDRNPGMKRRDLIRHLERTVVGCSARAAGTVSTSTPRGKRPRPCRDTTKSTNTSRGRSAATSRCRSRSRSPKPGSHRTAIGRQCWCSPPSAFACRMPVRRASEPSRDLEAEAGEVVLDPVPVLADGHELPALVRPAVDRVLLDQRPGLARAERDVEALAGVAIDDPHAAPGHRLEAPELIGPAVDGALLDRRGAAPRNHRVRRGIARSARLTRRWYAVAAGSGVAAAGGTGAILAGSMVGVGASREEKRKGVASAAAKAARTTRAASGRGRGVSAGRKSNASSNSGGEDHGGDSGVSGRRGRLDSTRRTAWDQGPRAMSRDGVGIGTFEDSEPSPHAIRTDHLRRGGRGPAPASLGPGHPADRIEDPLCLLAAGLPLRLRRGVVEAGLVAELVDLQRGLGLGQVVLDLLAGPAGEGVEVGLLPHRSSARRRWSTRPGP